MAKILSLGELTRHGRARRVTVLMGTGPPVRLHDLGVWLDPESGVAHLLDAAMTQHLATAPLSATFVEWEDLSEVRCGPAGP